MTGESIQTWVDLDAGGAEFDRFTNGERGGYLLGGPSSGELAADTPVGAVIGKGLQIAGKAVAPIARKIASAAKGQLDDAARVVKNLFSGAKSAAAESAEAVAPKVVPRTIGKIGDLTKEEAAALRNIWQGGPRAQLPLRTREQLADLYSGVAKKNKAGSAQSAFNQARADYLLGRGPNPGKDVNSFAERMGLEIFKRQ